MKRKTNLFYDATVEDSNFITFSNYAESLTGNFLSTDTKLYPSVFLCAYSPVLENSFNYVDKKNELIKSYLASHYENKLAFLRDYYDTQDISVENNVVPLNYLLDILKSFDKEITFPYVSNVTEQDFKGSFTDTICLVNSDNVVKGELKYVDEREKKINYTDQTTYLYGWSNDSTYGDINSICIERNNTEPFTYTSITRYNSYAWTSPFDVVAFTTKRNPEIGDITYWDGETTIKAWKGNIIKREYTPIYTGPSNYSSYNVKLDYKETTSSYEYSKGYYADSTYTGFTTHKEDVDAVKFNIIIPLYNVVNVNNPEDYNVAVIDNLDDINGNYTTNVPFGMWFSGKESVVLKKDANYGQTWSLSISSQFKPFPTSSYVPTEITNDSNTDAFLTFSYILTKQNNLLDKFNSFNKTIADFNSRLNALESIVKEIGTTYSITAINEELVSLNNRVKKLEEQNN